ncbi:MAG: metal ABC transporter permease [Sulfurovaceae bacterium]|nr:metal ABC transporter permease [Sulfurovaceae bacterium]
MFEIFTVDFMQNALMAGVLVSLISGIIGSLIVVNRMVFLAGGIAHTSYGGIGLAIFLGLPIFLGASIFAVAASILMAFLALKYKERVDTFIGLIWATGMAIGVILIDLTPGYNVDLMSYLFGSILAVETSDLYTMFSVFVMILIFVIFGYRNILAVSYDSEYAHIRGVNVGLFYTLILVVSSIGIVMTMKVVGLILVISMLTIPVFIAEKISNSLIGMMIVSGLISTLFTIIGLMVSYYYNLTTGATIILVSVVGMILFLTIKKIYDLFKRGTIA